MSRLSELLEAILKIRCGETWHNGVVMTTSSDALNAPDARPAECAPFLPPARTTTVGTFPTVPDRPEAGAPAPDAPYVPAPAPVVTPPPAEPVFDARAMVESQKRVNTNPAYGALPTASDASREARDELREKAARQRRRNKRVSTLVGLVVLGGIGAGGWFVYQEYRDGPDQGAVELVDDAEATSDDIADDDAALTPIGEQTEIIAAQDALEDNSQLGAGGLGRAVDQARSVVGEVNGDADDAAEADSSADASAEATAEPAPSLAVADIVPPVVVEIGERLPDLTGRETYLVDGDEFVDADAAAFSRFIRVLSNQPQVSPGALTAEGLPEPGPGQIVISVERDGDQLTRVLVASAPEIGIDVDHRS